MKRLIRFVAGLYPRSWQERYGAEFAALLEDVNPDWRTSVDILKGALEMQMRALNFGKIALSAGVAGALAAAGVALEIPKQYVSQAVLKVAGPTNRSDQTDAVVALAQQALSRNSLAAVINSEGLYQRERGRMPIQDVIDTMKKNVSISSISGPLRDGAPLAFAIGFTYIDPHKAQRVTQDLTSSFIEGNMRLTEQHGAGQLTLQVLDVASLPQKAVSPNRWMIGMVGLGTGCGAALAMLLAIKLRARTA